MKLWWSKVRPTEAPPVAPSPRVHPPSLVEEARRHPGGWVYSIREDYDPLGTVPFHAIRGWWKVDESGLIEGEFVANPEFDAAAPRPVAP